MLQHENISDLASEYDINSPAMISNWVRSYLENGYNLIIKKRGRQRMTNHEDFLLKNKDKNQNNKTTKEKQQEEKIEYLQAEIAYLKKFRELMKKKEESKQNKK
ncbi:helix-turn-helix domain-containing protein [Candidatus Mycoplasma pogonae]